MRDETLMDIATSNFRQALNAYQHDTGDERGLNLVGYLLQQATELCIKHCMEINGMRYPHTHIIEDLLDECTGIVKYDMEFYSFAPAISKWEAKSRYIKNYRLALMQVQSGFRFIKKFLLDNGATPESLELPVTKLRDMNLF